MNQLPTVFVPTATLLARVNTSEAIVEPSMFAIRDGLVKQANAITEVVAENQADAAALLGEIQRLLNEVEQARVAVKKPFLLVGRRIEAASEDYCRTLETAKAHLKTILAQFAEAETARQREAGRKQAEELAALRAQRQQAEASGDVEAVLATDLKAADLLTAPILAEKIAGVATQEKWVVKVVRPDLLYAQHPQLVELQPRLREINAHVKKLAATLPDGEAPALAGCEITKAFEVRAR